MTSKIKSILYVDDDAEDREFLSLALKTADPSVEVVMVENGLEALNYLGQTKESRLPCLIVLDLNMPYLDGKETYARLRSDEVLGKVPVIIFSSGEKPNDKKMFNDLGIEYFTKPTEMSYLNNIASHMVNVCCSCPGNA